MTTHIDILTAAKQRAVAKSLPYLGELTPQEAFDILKDPATLLVDVRSRAELELVGRIPNAVAIEWAFYPGMVASRIPPRLSASSASSLAVVKMTRSAKRSVMPRNGATSV